MPPAAVAESFHLPPVLRTAGGEVRRAGFEMEYAGVTILRSALLVREVFGGDRHVASAFRHTIGTPFGEFACEIDATLLKDRTYEKPLRALGIDPDRLDLKWLEDALVTTLSTVVPIEIASPPIPVDRLAPLDELRRRLLEAGARGTRASVLYAFGMHINPELAGDDPASVRDVMRAFFLLLPWLKREAEVDLTRSISPYINAFPQAYARLILQPDYPADTARLIDDYLRFNPTRNRPLDLLPVLAHLDRDRVMGQVQDKHLVKPRPAFHYRLPNCMIDEPGWTLAREWNTWVAIERLAANPDKLAAMSRDYLAADERSFRPFLDRWPDVLESYL